MKRGGKLLILIAALIAAAAAYAYISRNAEEADGEDSSSGSDFIQVFSTSRDSVRGITWTYGGGEYSIKRDGADKDWYCPDDAELAIEQSYAAAMLASVYSVTADSSFAPAEELSSYGLDPAETSVTIMLEDGSEYSFYSGSYNSFSSSYYMAFSGSSEIYLTDAPMTSAFSYAVSDMAAAEESETSSGSAG